MAVFYFNSRTNLVEEVQPYWDSMRDLLLEEPTLTLEDLVRRGHAELAKTNNPFRGMLVDIQLKDGSLMRTYAHSLGIDVS